MLTTSISAGGDETTTTWSESLGTTSLWIETLTSSSDEAVASSGESESSGSDSTSGQTDPASTTGAFASSGGETSSGAETTGVPSDLVGTCEHPILVEAGGRYAIEDLATGERALESRLEYCTGGNGDEQVFQLNPTTSGLVRVEVDGVPNVVLYVLASCEDTAPALACANRAPAQSSEMVEFSVQQGRSYTIVVEGTSSLQRGAFELAVSEIHGEDDCSNGADDNDDSLVDCQDPSCAGHETCLQAILAACEAGAEITTGTTRLGNTRTAGTALFAPVAPRCVGGSGAPTAIHRYRAASTQALRVELFSGEWHGWFVRRDCDDPGTQTHCHVDSGYYESSIGYALLDEPGDYALFVAAFDAPGGAYELQVDAAEVDEAEPNDVSGANNLLMHDGVGYISSWSDVDRWQFELDEPATVRIATSSPFGAHDCEVGPLDTTLEIASNGVPLAENDDPYDYTSYCAELELELEAGIYEAVVRPYEYCSECRFSYSIHLE